MTVLDILRYPDKRLNQVAKPVREVDARIRQLVHDMAETMYDAPGIGLAATQVDVHERVIVIDISEDKNDLLVFINPQIITSSSELRSYEEGCLSVPGVYEPVDRPDRVTVQALDIDGNAFTIDCEGLLAVCIQHEIDHLQGKVFVRYLSRLKQSRIKSRMSKIDRQAA